MQPHVSRHDALASSIAEIFAQEFATGAIDTAGNFFDMGGDSLMAENIILAINARFGVKLQTAALLEAQSPDELAAIVGGMFSDHLAAKLVTKVSGGKGKPIAMIHGFSGSSLFANRFGPRLKAGHTIYAVRALGIEPKEKASCAVGEIASNYYEGLKSASGRVPTIIGGICLGGLLAIDVGRLAHEETGIRPAIILIDPPPPGSLWSQPDLGDAGALRRRKMKLRHVEYWQRVRDVSQALGLGQTSFGRHARQKAFKKATLKAMRGYVPASYPCDLLVLASAQWGGHTVDSFHAWANADVTVRTVVMPGDHGGFKDANMAAIDAEILDFLAKHDTRGAGAPRLRSEAGEEVSRRHA